MKQGTIGLLCVSVVVLCLVCAGSVSAASWTTYQLLNDGSETYCKDPHCWPASNGGFHAFYKDATNSNSWYCRYKRHNGSSLGTRYTVPNTAWPGGRGDISVGLDGTIWCAWENWAANNEQIYAAKSTNGGQNWTSYNVTQYSYPAGRDGEGKTPELCPWGTSGGNLMIAHWQAYEKKLKYNTWTGSVMSSVIDTGITTDNQYALTGVCHSPYDGNMYRCYGRKISNVWQICYRVWNGSSWSSEVVVSTNTGSPYVARGSIAVNALNQVLVVWDQDSHVMYRYHDGSAWQPMGDMGDGYSPTVTYIPGTSSFYCVYCPSNRTQNYVYGRRFIFGQWDPEDTVSLGMGAWYTVTPDICAEPNGKLWCVWESWPNNAQMYYASCSDFTVQDSTAPVFSGPVYDDGVSTDLSTFLHATWNAATDPETGIHHYEYSIGTSAGATNVVGWTNSGTDLEMICSRAFATGTYYINVKAFNNAGLASSVVSSDGIAVSCPANPMTFPAAASIESSSRACANVMMTKGADGGLHLVYDITDPYVHYRHRTSAGVWETAVGIVVGKYPDIAEDTTGALHCVYTTTDGRENMTLAEIIKTGGSWGSGANIYTGMDWYPRLVKGVSGQVSLINNAGTSFNVSFATRTTSWPSLTNIGTSARYGNPDMAMGTDGAYHAVWVSGNNLTYRKYSGSWQTAVTVASGSSYIMPRIALDSSNNPSIVWAGAFQDSGYQINYSRWTGSAWTAPRIVGYGHYPNIAIDQNNKTHIAYSFFVGAKYDIMHVVFDGTSWSTAINLSNNAGDSLRPALEVTNDNGVHVAWQDDSNRTNAQVFWTTSASTPTTGTISGFVRDAGSNPIGGATVSITGGQSTTSASDGSYTLSSVAPGTYNVTASKAGYQPQTQYNKTVTAGQVTSVSFNLTLIPGTVSGWVKDTNNNALVSASVVTSPGSYSATTDGSGNYTINNVPQGTYSVTASKTGYLSDTQTNKSVVSAQTTTVNFNLATNKGKISGTVKDECGDVLSGATVSTNTGGYTTTSAADGTYLLDDVTAGTYSVTATKSGYNSQTNNGVAVTGGQTTISNLTLSLRTQVEELLNGSFEAGFFSFWGGYMANSWGATWRSTSSGATWADYNAGGSYGHTQSVYVGNQGQEDGIIQVVSGLTPGATFVFSAYAYQTSTNSSCWIGTDPNGGTALPSRTTSFSNVAGQWNYQSVTGTVGASGTVSVFLWVWHQWNPAGTCYFNNASLLVTRAGTPGKIQGVVVDQGGAPVGGATVATATGGYTTTSASDGSYALNDVTPATYSVTASKSGYNPQTKNVTVAACTTSVTDFTITLPTEKVTNGNMEGGFYNTGWGSSCSGVTSQLPNPNGTWQWNNDASYPFNTLDSTSIKHAGSHSTGLAFCQTAASPGKMGVIWQSVNLGAPSVSKTFTVWAYHTDGNCPSIMCWNPGSNQSDPYAANTAGRYQWVCTDNWGQRNVWVSRSMTVTSDASGYVTIMAGGAAHPGTAGGARLYVDDVSVQ